MAQLHLPATRPIAPAGALRYVRPPAPLHFPDEELVPESRTHLVIRTFLFRLLRFALGAEHRVGSDQFLYWNAADPKRSLAPDALLKLHVPDAPIRSWKTWEDGGVPDLAVEIVSDSDRRSWADKLSDYQEIGIREIVRFDPTAPPGKRVRAWDRMSEDLVERVVQGDRTPCLVLGLHWVVRPVEDEPVALRLEDDAGKLLQVAEERADERTRAAEERTQAAEERMQAAERRAEAEARVRAELEERIRLLEAQARAR